VTGFTRIGAPASAIACLLIPLPESQPTVSVRRHFLVKPIVAQRHRSCALFSVVMQKRHNRAKLPATRMPTRASQGYRNCAAMFPSLSQSLTASTHSSEAISRRLPR
jgi:hypothetical protein